MEEIYELVENKRIFVRKKILFCEKKKKTWKSKKK